MTDAELERFWMGARTAVASLPVEVPEAWAFGATAVDIVPFAEVGPEHARSEVEGDRTLTAWREIHERFWRRFGSSARGFSREMPVVCERFRVVFAAAAV